MIRYEPKKSNDELQAGDLVKLKNLGSTFDGKVLVIAECGDDVGDILTLNNLDGIQFGYAYNSERNIEHVPRRLIETIDDFEVGDTVYIRPESPYCGKSDSSNPDSSVHGEVVWAVSGDLQVRWPSGGVNGYGTGTTEGGYASDGLPHLALVDEYSSAACKPVDKTEPVEGILFGSDLELFVENTETGKIVPAGLLVPGSKDEPFQMQNGTVHPDGISVEVGCPPASTMTELMDNLKSILDEVKQEFFPEDKYQYSEEPMAKAGDIQDFEKHKQENPDWFISGCAPELTLNLLYGNSEPVDVQRKQKQRCTDKFFVGFHLHYGFTEWEDAPSTRIDAAALVEKVTERVSYTSGNLGHERTKYYGGDGVFRVKPYGVEDRSLAGHVFFNPKIAYEQAYQYQKLIKEALCK